MVTPNLHSHVSQMEIILEISCTGVYSLSLTQKKKRLPILSLYCGITVVLFQSLQRLNGTHKAI